ncbi:MAG: hypothetical protein ACKOAU_02800 [Pirellula sp.]
MPTPIQVWGASPAFAVSLSYQTDMFHFESLVQTLIREGHWSEAICLYRDELGVSQVQAEARVQALAEELGVTDPYRWTQWIAMGLATCALLVLAGCLQWYLT